jgi:hypothetical protein
MTRPGRLSSPRPAAGRPIHQPAVEPTTRQPLASSGRSSTARMGDSWQFPRSGTKTLLDSGNRLIRPSPFNAAENNNKIAVLSPNCNGALASAIQAGNSLASPEVQEGQENARRHRVEGESRGPSVVPGSKGEAPPMVCHHPPGCPAGG